MPTTTPDALPYPDPNGDVRNGAADIEALADATQAALSAHASTLGALADAVTDAAADTASALTAAQFKTDLRAFSDIAGNPGLNPAGWSTISPSSLFICGPTGSVVLTVSIVAYTATQDLTAGLGYQLGDDDGNVVQAAADARSITFSIEQDQQNVATWTWRVTGLTPGQVYEVLPAVRSTSANVWHVTQRSVVVWQG